MSTTRAQLLEPLRTAPQILQGKSKREVAQLALDGQVSPEEAGFRKRSGSTPVPLAARLSDNP
jgi:hypothetical protein